LEHVGIDGGEVCFEEGKEALDGLFVLSHMGREGTGGDEEGEEFGKGEGGKAGGID